MGITLQAIVEVQIEGTPGMSRFPRYWEDVSTWEFCKNYELSMALDEVTERCWPRTPDARHGHLATYDDPEVTSARREVDHLDIGENYRWASLERLRTLSPPDPTDPDAAYVFRGRFYALLASCEELAKHYESVRVLFYST